MKRRRALVLLLVCAAGCGAGIESAEVRAASDLQCPKEHLVTRVLVDKLYTGRTIEVRGCGRTLTYVQICESESLVSCAWTR